MSKTTKVVIAVVLVVVGLPVIIMVLAMSNFFSIARQTLSSTASYGVVNQKMAYPLEARDEMMAPMSEPSYTSAPQDKMMIRPPVGVGGSVAADATSRLIVKNGSLSAVVKDVSEAIKTISSYIESHKGFVVESNISKAGNAPYGVVIARIPASEFEASVSYIKTLGSVMSESVNGSDVTAEYIDLDSQLKNLQAAEQQFLAIMKKADKIADILAVQNQLTQVRGQIESIQGRMKYLKETAEMSSLTINLSTDPSALPVVDKDTNTWKPLAVFKDAVRSLVEVGKGLLNFVIWILIFSPVWGGIILIIWLLYRRMHKKNSSRK
jgi:hypothetical protein